LDRTGPHLNGPGPGVIHRGPGAGAGDGWLLSRVATARASRATGAAAVSAAGAATGAAAGVSTIGAGGSRAALATALAAVASAGVGGVRIDLSLWAIGSQRAR
jgi:hypothetical protein